MLDEGRAFGGSGSRGTECGRPERESSPGILPSLPRAGKIPQKLYLRQPNDSHVFNKNQSVQCSDTALGRLPGELWDFCLQIELRFIELRLVVSRVYQSNLDESAGESLSVPKLYHIRHPTRRPLDPPMCGPLPCRRAQS